MLIRNKLGIVDLLLHSHLRGSNSMSCQESLWALVPLKAAPGFPLAPMELLTVRRIRPFVRDALGVMDLLSPVVRMGTNPCCRTGIQDEYSSPARTEKRRSSFTRICREGFRLLEEAVCTAGPNSGGGAAVHIVGNGAPSSTAVQSPLAAEPVWLR